jgi:hypothetical protein
MEEIKSIFSNTHLHFFTERVLLQFFPSVRSQVIGFQRHSFAVDAFVDRADTIFNDLCPPFPVACKSRYEIIEDYNGGVDS